MPSALPSIRTSAVADSAFAFLVLLLACGCAGPKISEAFSGFRGPMVLTERPITSLTATLQLSDSRINGTPVLDGSVREDELRQAVSDLTNLLVESHLFSEVGTPASPDAAGSAITLRLSVNEKESTHIGAGAGTTFLIEFLSLGLARSATPGRYDYESTMTLYASDATGETKKYTTTSTAKARWREDYRYCHRNSIEARIGARNRVTASNINSLVAQLVRDDSFFLRQ